MIHSTGVLPTTSSLTSRLVHDNVNITGDTSLTFGSAADSYTFIDPARPTGGMIDAHADTGGVTAWLKAGPTAAGNAGANVYWWTGRRAPLTWQNIGGAVVDFTHRRN